MNSVASVQSDHWAGISCFLDTMDILWRERLLFSSTWAVASTPAQTNKLTKSMLHKLLWSNRLNLPTFGKHPQNSENIWKSNVKPKPDSRWRKTRQDETCGAPVLSLSTGDQWQQLPAWPVATHGGNYATTIFNFWLHKNNNVNKVRTGNLKKLNGRDCNVFNGEK